MLEAHQLQHCREGDGADSDEPAVVLEGVRRGGEVQDGGHRIEFRFETPNRQPNSCQKRQGRVRSSCWFSPDDQILNQDTVGSESVVGTYRSYGDLEQLVRVGGRQRHWRGYLRWLRLRSVVFAKVRPLSGFKPRERRFDDVTDVHCFVIIISVCPCG